MLFLEVGKNKANLKFGKNAGHKDRILKNALFKTASHGRDLIEKHMDTGTSYKGGAFKPYSAKYKEFRREKGRSTRPNLQFTKQMRSALAVKANSKQGVIFFTRAQEAKKAAKNDKTRPFFGFNRAEMTQLEKVFERHLK